MIARDDTSIWPLHLRPSPDTTDEAGFQIRESVDTDDPAWDAFLAQTPGGHHVQTSLWARVKARVGWRSVRLVVLRSGRIAAGAQILTRGLPLVGSIGYVPKGPLLTSDDPKLARLVVNEMRQIARKHRIQFLAVQPPDNAEVFDRLLPDHGFQPAALELVPMATVLIDLNKNVDTILADMSRKTRYNVRLGERKGITVREGTEHDIPTYYRMVVETSRRQEFAPQPEEYFRELWRIFHPHGYVKLLVAEYEGEVVSAQLGIPFGDTWINKLSVWSGRHGDRRPNEALQWAAIQWAKSNGYRYYDFEGIEPEAARAALRHEPVSDEFSQTVTSFKLGFGGEVRLFPGVHTFVHNPLLRLAFRLLRPAIAESSTAHSLLHRLRTLSR
jgi:lipid II:glycine glycyltransferase (peptidoglycan interpeptide bridge formation enzyme)